MKVPGTWLHKDRVKFHEIFKNLQKVKRDYALRECIIYRNCSGTMKS